MIALAVEAPESAPPGRPARSIIDEAIDVWMAAGSPQSQASREGAYWIAEAMSAFRAQGQITSADLGPAYRRS